MISFICLPCLSRGGAGSFVYREKKTAALTFAATCAALYRTGDGTKRDIPFILSDDDYFSNTMVTLVRSFLRNSSESIPFEGSEESGVISPDLILAKSALY